MVGQVMSIKGYKEAPRASRSAMETLIVTRKDVDGWRLPPFQRPLRVNDRVKQVAAELVATGGVIQGVITLGRIKPDRSLYVVDGQHRLEAFKISGLPEVILDARIVDFDDLADMANEFVRLNTALVKMRPDDVLRGLEGSVPSVGRIIAECPFVGYDNIRRGDSSPVLSMSMVIRAWAQSRSETPSSGSATRSSGSLAAEIDETACDHLIEFLQIAFAAWGRDHAARRLWGVLNMTLCLWLWRALVIDRARGLKRSVVLSAESFRRCLMALGADADYGDWLVGRALTDRDRAPCYARIRAIFAKRLAQDDPGKRHLLPQPAWAKS